MPYTVKKWVQDVEAELAKKGQETFFYRDLPSELRNDSYFRRASRRGHIRKCGAVPATGKSGGFISEWMIANIGGRI